MIKALDRKPTATSGMTSIRDFAAAKAAGRKIAVVTAYDAWSARLLAKSSIDALLVGDSAMMVIHGERDTLGATVELMALHTRAVARGAPETAIIADMPFLSVRQGTVRALDSAAQLLRAGAHAVKVEGARGHTDVIHHLVESGIPVMGHLGLTPQSVHQLGGYRVQAREAVAAAQLQEDAVALEAAGVFALVLECIPQSLAAEVTAACRRPTIGIGAGAHCDGQVLVLQDLLGLSPEFHPRFARAFVDGAELVHRGATRFSSAVRDGTFPDIEEAFQ